MSGNAQTPRDAAISLPDVGFCTAKYSEQGKSTEKEREP
jgi:hypothetical protein